MKEGRDAPSRETLKERDQKFGDDFHEKDERMGKDTEDVECIRQTGEELEYHGTAEGKDDVRESVNAAEEAAVETFERDDGELESIQEESKEYEEDIRERSEATEVDREKLSDAGDKVTIQEAKDALVRAGEAVEQDLEILKEHLDHIIQAFEQSEQAQADYRSRVHGQGRSE